MTGRLAPMTAMTQLILFNLFNGLIIGAFYALMALGLSLILNLSGVINFAHGGFLAIGGYLAYTLIPYVGFWGALAIAPVLTAAHRPPGRARADPPALWPRSALQPAADLRARLHARGRHALHLGARQTRAVHDPGLARRARSAAEFFFLTGYRLFMVALVVVAVAALFLILTRTRLGMRIRAGTLDLETVSVLGVNVRILRNLNFGLGIYLAGLAGVLAAGMLGLQPTIGSTLIMPSFVAIIIGGLGSLPGTLLGGLLIGVASGITTVFFPSASRGGDLRDDGAGPAGPAARPARRGGPVLVDARSRKRARRRRHLAAAADDALLAQLRSAATRRSAPACWCWRWPRWRSISCWASPACCRSAMPPISASAPMASA